MCFDYILFQENIKKSHVLQFSIEFNSQLNSILLLSFAYFNEQPKVFLRFLHVDLIMS